MIEKKEFVIRNNSEQIFTIQWHPDSNKKLGSIVLIHGLGEHTGRYSTHFAKFWTDHGFSIFSFDLPGFGQSSGKKGHIKNPDAVLDFISETIQKSKKINNDLPVFIYGHSLGGEISLWYSLERKPSVNGIIASAPVIGPKDAIPAVRLFLAKIMNIIYPGFTMDNGINTSLLSKDEKIVQAYVADPLVHRLVSARLGITILNKGNWLLTHTAENKIPTLIMVCDDDGLVKVEPILNFAEAAPLVELKVWQGLYHELHNEPEREKVFDYSLKWVLEHL